MTKKPVSQHFVTFLSPGTFVAEHRTLPVESWDVERAQAMASEVVERYNARPYGFYFTTRGRGPDDLDSRELKRSGTYFLGGTIRTVDDVRADAKSDERILLSNMVGNGYARVVENHNSWKWTQPLGDKDVVLPEPAWAGAAVPEGTDG